MSGKVLAGDFPQNSTITASGSTIKIQHNGICETLNGNVAGIQALSERTTPGIGLGIGVALGPIALIPGGLRVGSKTEVCFACLLSDGRRFIAQTDLGTFEVFASDVTRSQQLAAWQALYGNR